jgi:hypothetical protein
MSYFMKSGTVSEDMKYLYRSVVFFVPAGACLGYDTRPSSTLV